MATEVRLPARIGRRYRVERALGKGGMARVYAALDEQSGALVALKQLTSEVMEKAQGAALLFEREFHTLRQLRHPHIVEAYDYGVEDGRPFYTMELLEGSDLRELAPCDWRLACRLMREVATALALLHSRRLIHRDLSPRNLWRTPDGAVKLIDFGAMGTHGSLSLQLIGTPPFTAPEVYHRQTIDPRTDLYALGAIGYWLLTGAHAYPASRLRNLPEAWKRPPPSASAIAGGVPEGLVQLIRSLLSLEMVARPRCAAEVIERLDVLLGEPQAQGPAVAEGYLITPSLVGRSRELAELQAHIDGLSQGRSGVVVIECAAGQGRSRLLQEASLVARLAGATVLDVGAAAQPHRAYGVARGLVAALARAMPESDRAALPAGVRELVRAGGARP